MDAIDVFLRGLHATLGHDKTADYIGAPRGRKEDCALCHPELLEKEASK